MRLKKRMDDEGNVIGGLDNGRYKVFALHWPDGSVRQTAVVPASMTLVDMSAGFRRLYARFKLPIVVTEHGEFSASDAMWFCVPRADEATMAAFTDCDLDVARRVANVPHADAETIERYAAEYTDADIARHERLTKIFEAQMGGDTPAYLKILTGKESKDDKRTKTSATASEALSY